MHISSLLAILPLALANPLVKAPVFKRDEHGVQGKYIVKLKGSPGASSTISLVEEITNSVGVKPDHVYKHIGGLSASLDEKEIEKLRMNPNVAYIEQASEFRLFAMQENATWGLARISSRWRSTSVYEYDDSAGQGTCSYVIDTGIDTGHDDFEGRASFVASFVPNVTDDDLGHGTHCAGTLGSTTYGVAKKTWLLSVKVFDKRGSANTTEIIAGMDKVIEDAKTRHCPKGVIVSMSFGGSRSQAMNDAAKALVDAGFFAAVAAGNGDMFGNPLHAGSFSPASEPSVCTIGATQEDDNVARFSNFGEVLDLYAPGVNIVSLKPGGGTAKLSGTSMATPHVAGLAAYFMGIGESARGLCEYLQSIALKDELTGVVRGTKNLLIQNDQAAWT